MGIETLALAGLAVGTGLTVGSTLQEGRRAEDIAEQRAAVDLADVQAVDEAAEDEARVTREKGRRLLATQQSVLAAGGIRLNVGLPLVIAAETEAEIAKEIGFGLETARAESAALRSRAGFEIDIGRAAKRKSRFLALSQGLLGIANIGSRAKDAGLFGRQTTVSPAGTFRRGTGTGQVEFGRRFISS